MIVTCPRCREMFNATSADHAYCPRCTAMAELLAATEALNRRVKSELERGSRFLPVVVVRRDGLTALVQRAECAVARARSA